MDCKRQTMDYKSQTRDCYNNHAKEFEKSLQVNFRRDVQSYASEFSDLVQKFADKLCSQRARVLDLGSGPGHHSEYFTEKGLAPLCVDLSSEMVSRCRERGLAAQVMDMENLLLPANRFHGVWAYTSILHVPKKNIPDLVENNIVRVLKLNGYLGLAVKEGAGEGFENCKRHNGKRWFSYFKDNEIRKLFSKFTVLRSGKTLNGDNVFLHYIMQLKLG